MFDKQFRNKSLHFVICVIATVFAACFFDTLKFFWPEEEKTVVLIGDESMTRYAGKKEGIEIRYSHANHYPWPILSMYKFHLIKDNKVAGAKFHFLFNANILFCDVDFDYSFFKRGIVCTQHASFDYRRKDYVQGASISLPDEVFDVFCNEHVLRVNEYIQKLHRVPEWHDETVLNEMLIHDKAFDFNFFPIEKGLRWLWYDESPWPQKGLCYLCNKEFQKNFKNDYKNAISAKSGIGQRIISKCRQILRRILK